MLETPKQKNHKARNLRRERRLWYDPRNTPSLGCKACPDFGICGGLTIEQPVFSCLDYCCGGKKDCDVVCPNRPSKFSKHIREIKGFSLENIPRANGRRIDSPLPRVVPVIFAGHSRIGDFAPSAVCLPLYSLLSRHGTGRFNSAAELAQHFHFKVGLPIVLTGTATDPSLEKWWRLGSEVRINFIRNLTNLNVVMATAPNYSLFIDQPRWDDLHNIKRIGITYEELLSGGIATALHVNARTEQDWDRWAGFIAGRDEVTDVAFEFATGAGWAGRVEWQTAHLLGLAKAVGRPLRLLVRAAKPATIETLRASFGELIVLDTATYMKTIKRRRAEVGLDGALKWAGYPTPAGSPLDELLDHNWKTVRENYERMFSNHFVDEAAG